jgi:broad specificity phosphatase PhoE
MAPRLLIIAHAETPGSRALVFGDGSEPAATERRWGARVGRWVSAPDPACRATAEQMGTGVTIADDLAGCDFGRWAGRTLVDVGVAEPQAVATWLSDPYAAPHGGESLATMLARVGTYVDGADWPDGRSAAVVTPLVARALVVHALGAPPEVIFRIDVPPLGRATISRSGPQWRLQELSPSAGRTAPRLT